MAHPALLVNEGRDALITYLLNDSYGSQDDTIFLKQFKLYTNLTGSPVQIDTLASLSTKLITGGTFDIASRQLLAGNILRCNCITDSAWSSGLDDIAGIGITFEKLDGAGPGTVEGLLGYAIFDTPFNKPADTNLSFRVDFQF
jgi:hypothetical protein